METEQNLEALRSGDRLAFAHTFESLHRKVFGFFMNRTRGDRDLAKDLTQQTFIKLWQSRHTLSTELPIDRQVFRIAKHTLIDFIRKEAVRQKGATSLAAKAGAEHPAELSVTAFEHTDFIQAVLRRLPPVRKKVIQLKVIQGYSNKEIADLLSISIKTVEDHVTKGFRELRPVN